MIALFMTLALQATAFAAINTYALKMEVKVDGKLQSAPVLQVREGKMASVSERTDKGGTFVDVEANQSKGGSVLMHFTVGTLDAKGKRTVLATPVIMALESEPATFQIKEKGKIVSLKVTADRSVIPQ